MNSILLTNPELKPVYADLLDSYIDAIEFDQDAVLRSRRTRVGVMSSHYPPRIGMELERQANHDLVDVKLARIVLSDDSWLGSLLNG